MHNEHWLIDDDFDLYEPNPGSGSAEVQKISDWRTAAVPKFADLISQSFRKEFPHITTAAKLDRDSLVRHLFDALDDATHDIRTELENE
jgi:hypothetical protein